MNETRTRIFPWNLKSVGARNLSEALGVKRLKIENSTFVGSPNYTVINWGSSSLPETLLRCRVINDPQRVSEVSDKLLFFQIQKAAGGTRIPDFTESTKEALSWVRNGGTVLARTKLKASGGRGIVFLDDSIPEWISAELYTLYKPKREEYRIHIAFGEVISIQRKVLRKTDDLGNEIDPKDIDFRIRNLKNGFVFQRHSISPDQDVLTQALRAMEVSRLDFGAVDVIWNESEESAYVLEINAAPGLEGQTIQDYADAFRRNL